MSRKIRVAAGVALLAASLLVGGAPAVTAAAGACTSASMVGSDNSIMPPQPGDTITFNATSTGCPSPEYRFYLQGSDGVWRATTGYGPASWMWNTAGLNGGTYGVGVWARQVGSTAAYEAYWVGTYTLPVTTCQVASLGSATPSGMPAGTQVVWMANASPCTSPLFKFWVKPPYGSWTLMRGWGASTWTWDTTGLSGTYEIGVWAYQPKSPNSYDAYGITTFVVAPSTSCIVGMTPNLSPPLYPGGGPLVFTANSGCASPVYEFWLLPPDGTWRVVQGYSSSQDWGWVSIGYPTGTYQVGVWARNGYSSNSYDAFFVTTFQLDVTHCTAAAVTATPASPQPPGSTVVFQAGSSDCPNPNYRFWMLTPGASTWMLLRDWESTSSISLTTTGLGPGPYRFGVWAQQTGATSSYDSYSIVTFWLGT